MEEKFELLKAVHSCRLSLELWTAQTDANHDVNRTI